MSSIPERDRAVTLDVKVLGLKWDSQNDDTIRLQKPSMWETEKTKETKRSILQAIAAVFNPLGLYQPVLFQGKLLLQKLWIENYGWDDPITENLKQEWNKIRSEITPIVEHRVPRQIGEVDTKSTLVIFSDASTNGYGAVAYSRTEARPDYWCAYLLFAKSRLTPTNKKTKQSRGQITLPRLELIAAAIAGELAKFCRAGLNLPQAKVYFFIDSELVLYWLRSNPATLKRFVARRIEKLQKIENCVFDYVKTKENPADYLTRGKSATDLIAESQWWNGPNWLKANEKSWPKTQLGSVSDEALKEYSSNVAETEVCHTLAVTAKANDDNYFEKLLARTSSLQKLLRITAIWLKFLKLRIWKKLSAKAKETKHFLCIIFEGLSNEPKVSASDIETAKTFWISLVQRKHYSDVQEAIRKRQRHPLMLQLGLRLDNSGIIRSHSRYANADLDEGSKFPVLLPKNDKFSELVVNDVHNKLRHSGVSHTLSEIRLQYWIPQGRSFVRKILNQCLVCRKYKTGKPFSLPEMPPWPNERVERSTAFQYIGLDYFGPIKVRVGDEVQRMWGCIFACVATRAIHLEAVTDCSSSEFLNSVIRFISRRGCPSMIISDNAAQFHLVKVLADRDWKRLPSDPSVLSYASENGIRWKFITALAPWQGGHYERLVGVVKAVLKTAIGRRLLTWTDLITLLAETEAIVNSRPITYVSEDAESQFQVLRPVDFLLCRPKGPPADESEFPVRDLGDAGKRLASILKQRKRYLDKLWKHWYSEYLLSLRERAQCEHRNARGSVLSSPREGQVVLLKDDDLPRGQWKLGRIQNLTLSRDGKIRSATLRLANGVEFRRAINFLIPLEVEAPEDQGYSLSNSEAEGNLNDEFTGFSAEDIQRTIDTLGRFDSV